MAREEEVLDATRVKRTEIWPGTPEATKTAYVGVGVDWRGMYLAEVTESSARAGYPEFSKYHNSRVRIPDSGLITEALVNGSLNRDSSPVYTISPEQLNEATSRLTKPLVSLKPGDHVIVREPGKPPRMSRVYDTRKDLLTRDFALVGDTGEWYRTDGDAYGRGYTDDRSTAIVSATTIDGGIVPLYQAHYEKYQADLAAARRPKEPAPKAPEPEAQVPRTEAPVAAAAPASEALKGEAPAREFIGRKPTEQGREEAITQAFRDMGIADPGPEGTSLLQSYGTEMDVDILSVRKQHERIAKASSQWNPHNPKMQPRIQLAERIERGAASFMLNADEYTSAHRWDAVHRGLTQHADALAPQQKTQRPLSRPTFEPEPQPAAEVSMEM